MTDPPTKRCSRCRQSKRLEAFPRHAGRKHGRGAYCRGCCAVRWKESKRREAQRSLRLPSDVPGLPGFANKLKPRAPRTAAKTLDELLEAW